MVIYVHHEPGTYSDRWIKYCEKKGIPYKKVDCWNTEIMNQLEDCKALIWHWNLNNHRSGLAARQLTLSMEKKGIKVFPHFNNCWHYDDKIGQKYLFEAVKAPIAKSYVFFSRQDALQWINEADFPKVFKLKSGAGSSNVKLVKNKKQARLLVNQAFGNGFLPVDPYSRLKERFWMLKRDRDLHALKMVAGGFARLFILREVEKYAPKEKGYIYFQDFIPNNTFDTRLIVVGNRCFGARRYCRTNDFRASGSGLLSYNHSLIDLRKVALSFEVARKLGTKSIAFDIVSDGDQPRILEMSYCFTFDCCDPCEGYWDRDLVWHPGKFQPQEFMLDDFVQSLEKQEALELEHDMV